MPERVEIEPLLSSVVFRRSRAARRLSLRVSSLDGRVTLTLPCHVGEAEAKRFLRAQAEWIALRLAELPVRRPVSAAAALPLAGVETPVRLHDGKTANLTEAEGGAAILAPHDPGRRPKALMALYRFLARERLAAACDRHARALGKGFTRLSLRDTRSRWGSCSGRGALMFSWRLVMAPPEVLDYVAAHEVAHLRHMDHSPEFWRAVETLCPDFRPNRAWLRSKGSTLHHWDFAN